MDSKAFIRNVQKNLEPIAPVILPGIIKKQLSEAGSMDGTLTPELAKDFIKRMESALSMFLGPEGTKMAHQMMMKELRKAAPDYFEDLALL